MKNSDRAPIQVRSKSAIPKSFTITEKHVAYLEHRKNAGANSHSVLIRELIDREIELNPCGFVWSKRHDSI